MAEIPPVDIWELLFEREHLPFPKDHVIFRSAAGDTAYTYQDVKTRSEQFGKALQHRWNWQKGSVLIVMATNCVDTPLVTWGCHYAGGVVAPVNPGLSSPELQHQLVNSRAKGLVVHPQCLKVALEAVQLSQLPRDRVLVLGDSDVVTTVAQFIDEVPCADAPLARMAINPTQDMAFLVYSSGTTGRPKGVMISHRNVVAAVMLQAAADEDHVHWTRDRVLAVLPVYHIYGLICLVHLPLWLGISTTFMEKFDLQDFCELIQESSITHAYVAPPIILHLAKNSLVNKFNLTSLRMMTSGGAPLAAALINELYQRCRIPVRQAYGLSETTSVSHIQPWNSWQTAIGSNGPPLPGLEAKFVVTMSGTVAAKGEEGELWVRGPTVFNGYMDESDMTAACLTGDGWFKTGDIGYEDTVGNLHITDRAKDMIKFKGYQVAPTELEDILLNHPDIKDAAVIGVQNEDLQSEVPLAYIVLRDAEKESKEMAIDVLNYLKGQVMHYKHLRGGIIWTRQIPKSASGKILKRELKDLAGSIDKGKQIGAVDYTKYREAKL